MTYRLPPLNGLRAFEAAARHMSFKYAADELCVTAGAVSQHVKALETALGRSFFAARRGPSRSRPRAGTIRRRSAPPSRPSPRPPRRAAPGLRKRKLRLGIAPAVDKAACPVLSPSRFPQGRPWNRRITRQGRSGPVGRGRARRPAAHLGRGMRRPAYPSHRRPAGDSGRMPTILVTRPGIAGCRQHRTFAELLRA